MQDDQIPPYHEVYSAGYHMCHRNQLLKEIACLNNWPGTKPDHSFDKGFN